jgi:hypothetical protein
MHATDLVGINGITGVLLVYSCQRGVYPRDHVLPLRLPMWSIFYPICVYGLFKTLPTSQTIDLWRKMAA